MGLKIVLHNHLVEYTALHPVTKWAFIHFKHDQHPLFSLIPGDLQLLTEIPQRLIEKIFTRIPSRSGHLTYGEEN
jgi:hypothetical protein